MKKMKWLVAMLILAVVTSCASGPSAEELAKAQADSIAKADSIALVEKAKADSIAKLACDTPKVEAPVVKK